MFPTWQFTAGGVITLHGHFHGAFTGEVGRES